jgi:hypothetical protein
MTRSKRFLCFEVVEWRSHDDGGVDFYLCGRPCECTLIHRLIMKWRKVWT